MGVHLHWTQANSFELVERQNRWQPQEVRTRANPEGQLDPPKPTKWFYSPWLCKIRKTAFGIQGHFVIHCFVTAVLWVVGLLHLPHSIVNPQWEMTTKYYRNRSPNLGWVHPWVKTGICPSLEIGTKNQNFLENVTSAAQLRLIDLNLAMTIYVPVCHSHCTRARFTVLVSCSGEQAVHSCPLLCLQGQVAKLTSGLFYRWSLLRNSNMAPNVKAFTLSYDSRPFAACECWTQTSWQAMQRDNDYW